MTYTQAMVKLGADWHDVWNTKGFNKVAALALLRVTVQGTHWERCDDVKLKTLALNLRRRAKKNAHDSAVRETTRDEHGDLPATVVRRLAREHAKLTGDDTEIKAIHAVDKTRSNATRDEHGDLPLTVARRLAWEHGHLTGDWSAIDAIHAANNEYHQRKIAGWKEGAARGDAECARKLKAYYEACRAAFGAEVKINPERFSEIVANVRALSARLATDRLRINEAKEFVSGILSSERVARHETGGTFYLLVGLVGVYGADNCATQNDALQALVDLPFAASKSARGKTSTFRRVVRGFNRELADQDPTSCLCVADRCV